jgi:hypothetical protein
MGGSRVYGKAEWRRGERARREERTRRVRKVDVQGESVLPRYVMEDIDLHANHPSSSSRREGAGRGAPGLVSVMGSLT